MNSPVVIFCFNRPASLERLLDDLKRCSGFLEHPLYIFVDGARNDSEEEIVAKTERIAQDLLHPHKTITRRTSNLGLKQSLENGISRVLEEYDKVIVLEDDLRVGPNALGYFETALSTYKEERQVVSICGYAIGASADETSVAAHFLPMTHPWGWATWRDRWQAHRAGTAREMSLLSPSFKAHMNVFGLRNYLQMLKLTEAGFLNSWWIYWQLNAVNRHAVSLFPKQSHIGNAGLHGGTHASRTNLFVKALPEKKLADKPTEFPNEVLVDFDALDRVIRSSEARVLRFTGFLGAIKRKMKRIAGW